MAGRRRLDGYGPTQQARARMKRQRNAGSPPAGVTSLLGFVLALRGFQRRSQRHGTDMPRPFVGEHRIVLQAHRQTFGGGGAGATRLPGPLAVDHAATGADPEWFWRRMPKGPGRRAKSRDTSGQ